MQKRADVHNPFQAAPAVSVSVAAEDQQIQLRRCLIHKPSIYRCKARIAPDLCRINRIDSTFSQSAIADRPGQNRPRCEVKLMTKSHIALDPILMMTAPKAKRDD
jgi:hypothetical protein